MQYEEVSWYSYRLNREMRIKIYGHYGEAILAFPCFYKQSDDFANNGMIDTLSNYINDGKIKLFCVDSNDEDTVAYKGWDKAKAAYLFDQYHHYIIEEVLPFIYTKMGGKCLPYVVGCSMGGSHASINYFRRPELFKGILCLSGKYDLASFFGGYMDSNIYNNSPVHFLSNMPLEHKYINLYNQKRMIFVCGQGAYEDCVLSTNFWLKDLLNQKGIKAWYDIWGFDSNHDWPDWRYQMDHYLPLLLGM